MIEERGETVRGWLAGKRVPCAKRLVQLPVDLLLRLLPYLPFSPFAPMEPFIRKPFRITIPYGAFCENRLRGRTRQTT
jgi:hypothetical protein